MRNVAKIKDDQTLNNELYSIKEITSISKEEESILNQIYSDEKLITVVDRLISENLYSIKLTDDQDVDICKKVIVAIKNSDLDENLILKIVQFITNRFADKRIEFNERACFVASVLFKNDAFDINSKATVDKFKNVLPGFLIKSPRKLKDENVTEVTNKIADFTLNSDYYDENTNPMFIQRALHILKNDCSKEAILAVHSTFPKILERASERIFKQFSKELFDQLIDLTHYDLLENQFKSLSFLMKKDLEFFYLALDIFSKSKSEVLKAFLLFSIEKLECMSDFDKQLKIHLAFAEIFSTDDFKIDESNRESIITFVKKGMELFKV
jgi:hypothetical protein